MAVLAFAVVVGAAASAAGIATFATAFTIAYAIGSYVYRPKGPSSHTTDQLLNDLRVVGTEYGQSIPWIQGVMPVAGQIWWNTDRRPVYSTVTEDVGGGKGGGSEVSHTNITYEIDCLLGLCDVPINGVIRIWKNGDLIFNASGTASTGTLEASAATTSWRRITVYPGTDTQLPDPVYEAAVGSANACAYRGRGTVFIEGLNLGAGGQMVNLVFEVAVDGTSVVASFPTAPSYTFPAAFDPPGVVRSTKNYLFYTNNAQTTVKVVNRVSFNPKLELAWPTDGFSNQFSFIGTDKKGTAWFSRYQGGTNCSIYRLFPLGGLTWINMFNVGLTGMATFEYIDEFSFYGIASSTNASFVIGNINWVNHSATISFVFNFVPAWSSTLTFVNCGIVPNRLYVMSTINTSTFRIGYYNRTTGAAVTVLDVGAQWIGKVVIDWGYNIWFLGYGMTHTGPFQITKMDKDGNFITSITLPLLGTTAPGVLTTGMDMTITSTGIIYAWYGNTHLTPRVFVAIDSNTNTLLWSAGPYSVDADNTRTLVIGPYANSQHFVRSRIAADEVYVAADDRDIAIVTPTYPTVRTVVDKICARAGLDPTQWDSSDLATITTPVRGFAAGDSGRAALEHLSTAFYFDVVVSDKIYFRRRGRAPSATIPYTDLGATSNESQNGDAEPLEITQNSDAEIPAQVTVKYMNALDDYQSGIEYSDRLVSTLSKSTAETTLPMALLPSEAKAIANTIVLDQSASRLSTRISVLGNYTKIEPSDVILVQGPDGSTYRMRQVRRSDSFPVIDMDLISDDISALVNLGITSGTYTSSSSVANPPDTEMLLLDIPILRDEDDGPIFYVVVKGSENGLPGAGIFASTDDITFTQATSITGEGNFGVTTSTLTSYTGIRIFDENGTVTVVMPKALTSSTRDAIIASSTVNAILIGNEIIQFVTASLVSPGVYTLSTLLRGCRGTEWAMTGHTSLERAVMLTTTGMTKITLSTPEIGLLKYYKGVSIGQTVNDVESTPFTSALVSLKPFSPWDLKATRDASSNITLTWQRRSRLSVRMTGPLGITVPLDDVTEVYDLEFWQASYTILRRTIRINGTPTFTYTTAMQTADLQTLGGTVTVRIYQIHSVAGRGIVYQASA